jgi:hypothetical protein
MGKCGAIEDLNVLPFLVPQQGCNGITAMDMDHINGRGFSVKNFRCMLSKLLEFCVTL